MGVRKTVIQKNYDYGICQAGLDTQNGRRMEFHPFSARFAFFQVKSSPFFLSRGGQT